ncbi:hypothetical protein ACFE04_013262 [Oxalis oulophora]
MSSVAIYICLFSFVTLCQLSQGQNTPQDYLNSHNTARAQVSVGQIIWNATIATYAQNYVNQLKTNCQMVHSGGPYGENLAWSSGSMSGTQAVALWVNEKQYYDYSTNQCVNGAECRHYTQVVWANSVQLGCAKVTCNNGVSTIISCNYSPPGNYVNQRPY